MIVLDSNHIMSAMRQMAWERAKGELMSILQTYYGERDAYNEMEKLISDFINEIENESPLA